MGNREQKSEEIKEIITDIYKDKMSDEILYPFAEDLYESLFVCEYSLDDILAIIFEYESEMNLEFSEVSYVFGKLIDLLENNEINARRLYESFMNDFDCLDTFVKLYKEYVVYLSEEELSKAKEKAFGTFDKFTLELYGIKE